MGLDSTIFRRKLEEEALAIQSIFPKKPLVSEEEFKRIRSYFISHAPEKLVLPAPMTADTLSNFTPRPIPGLSSNVMMIYVATDSSLYFGTRSSKLYHVNSFLQPIDSFQVGSPPAEMAMDRDNQLLLEMGTMDPNDLANGDLSIRQGPYFRPVIYGLKRPVHVSSKDLNNDGNTDHVICSFGMFTGDLSVFDGNKRYILASTPGARITHLTDVDGNGFDDIYALLSQGDERIVLFSNYGDFSFRMRTLIQFPPVYGSSYLEMADFNRDGHLDILYTNGHNADYSQVMKPYHGIRIFQNNGQNEFSEAYFFDFPGAQKAIARDFDQDGDLDIAAISFFPDFNNNPSHGFVYLEKQPTGYTPFITHAAAWGRWLDIEAFDYGNDGDLDLILGAMNFPDLVPPELLSLWNQRNAPLLLLENTRSK